MVLLQVSCCKCGNFDTTVYAVCTAINSSLGICRFCMKECAKRHLYNLFSAASKREDLSGRLSKLLLVPLSQNDGLSQYMCRSCNINATKIEEKIHEMRKIARLSYQSSRTNYVSSLPHNTTSPLSTAKTHTRKWAKNTSSSTGISTFTQHSRPQSK